MNLDSFTMDTPESEFHRVVRHETGHTLGFPHEHMRGELVAKIDPDKAIAYFGGRRDGTRAEVRAQVLTPIEERLAAGERRTPTRRRSCATRSPGPSRRTASRSSAALDIDRSDQAFVGTVYPKKVRRS